MSEFYRLSAGQAVEELSTDAQVGLSGSEAERRLGQVGPNELERTGERPLILHFLDQFRDLFIIVLIIAAGLAWYLGDFRGGTILLIIVFVNALIGFYQEHKAERILESLKTITRASAVVVRDGQRQEVEQAQLVPGDLVQLQEGDVVPADLRLIETVNFATNDFILTGESEPQEKSADLVPDAEVPLSEQDNLAFMGLTVARGHAKGVVFATGMETAIGRLARETETIQHDLSPLQREINNLAKTLTKIAGVIALVLFVISFFLNVGPEDVRRTIELSILFAISIAAACVPQGLPAQITVALSLGVGRLAEKNAVVKKLSSVETLGATTVICSDKTGTLTQNEMTITHAVTFDRAEEGCCSTRVYGVTGQGYGPTGEVLEDDKPITDEIFQPLKQFFEDGFLASTGRVMPPDENRRGWYPIGDPSEAAFTPLVMKVGLDPDELETRFPVVEELSFDADRKRMTVIREHKGKIIGYMKGAMESVLDVCDRVKLSGEVVSLTDDIKAAIHAHGENFSSQALRIIALAWRDFPADSDSFSIENTEREFIFAGFVAMLDPPREGVEDAIASVYAGGMRTIMITGDAEATALAIARRIGMRDEGELRVYAGADLAAMTDGDLRDILSARSIVFSRVSPEDKYRIVSQLKDMGEVVAVTGDGVNDTLSLKKSDIGVAMGESGTDVAKQAADIILLDDNFRTLTSAVAEGRKIFDNLRKTVLASITSNNGELTCVLLGFIGIAAGLPIPITAVQILAIDLVGEMLPLMALTFDPAEKSLMQRPPRQLDDHIINRRSFTNLAFYGFWMGACGYFSFFMVYTHGTGTLEAGHAAAYTGIIFCQFMNILSRRTESTIFGPHLMTNPQLWISFVISLGAIGLLIYVPAVSIWFGFDALSATDLVYPVAGALLFLALHEAGKFLNIMRT